MQIFVVRRQGDCSASDHPKRCAHIVRDGSEQHEPSGRKSEQHSGTRRDPEAATSRFQQYFGRYTAPTLLVHLLSRDQHIGLRLLDGHGLNVIRRIRGWSPMPIVVLSARTLEERKIAALDAGADDYVTERLSAAEQRSVIHLGAIQIDLARREPPGGPVHLTRLEFRILACLTRHLGSIVTESLLMREV